MVKHASTDITKINLQGHYAGFISRVAAFAVDIIVLSVIIIGVTWFIQMTIDILQIKPIVVFMKNEFSWFRSLISIIFSPVTATIAGVVFVVLYHVFFWFFAGQTVGKALFGIKIVPLRGGRISIFRALLRYIGYFVTGFSLGIGFLWVIFDDRRMAWHDKLARTCVVYTWKARPDEKFLANYLKTIKSREMAIKDISAKKQDLAELMERQVVKDSLDHKYSRTIGED